MEARGPNKALELPEKVYAFSGSSLRAFGTKGGEENTQVLVVQESSCQDNVHRGQDKVLHCSALYDIIEVTK